MTYDFLRTSRSPVVRQQLRTVLIIPASRKRIIFGARRARTNCSTCSIRPACTPSFRSFLRSTMRLKARAARGNHEINHRPHPHVLDLTLGGLSNHFLAPGRRCGQPGQQHGRRFPASRSLTERWIRRLRVVSCLAEMTQQIHSFRASGVRSCQAARAAAPELRAARISPGSLCTGPGLVSFFTIVCLSHHELREW